MIKFTKLITKNHNKTKRDYFKRMNKFKIFNIKALKYSKNYWDGNEDIDTVDITKNIAKKLSKI